MWKHIIQNILKYLFLFVFPPLVYGSLQLKSLVWSICLEDWCTSSHHAIINTPSPLPYSPVRRTSQVLPTPGEGITQAHGHQDARGRATALKSIHHISQALSTLRLFSLLLFLLMVWVIYILTFLLTPILSQRCLELIRLYILYQTNQSYLIPNVMH